MKLTKEWIRECINGHVMYEAMADEIWKAAQLDREELRKEILKDHFKIGEILEVDIPVDGWTPCTVEVRGTKKALVYGKIRRPPKTRPLTREEKIEHLTITRVVPPSILTVVDNWAEELTNETLDNLGKIAKIPTEVEDDA